MDGRTLAGFWEGREDRSRPAFLESDVKMLEANRRRPHHGVVGKLRAVRDGRFKLILTPEEDGPRFELYDVIADPEEAHDLVLEESQKEVLAALQKQLAALIPKEERRALAEIRGKQGGGLNEPVDERDRELLQSLGYINQ
jgi:arylsulfatase A-like enzyme